MTTKYENRLTVALATATANAAAAAKAEIMQGRPTDDDFDTESQKVNFIEELSKKLRFYAYANDLMRLNHSRHLLTSLQYKDQTHDSSISSSQTPLAKTVNFCYRRRHSKKHSAISQSFSEELTSSGIDQYSEQFGEEYDVDRMSEPSPLSQESTSAAHESESAWRGYFKDYEILTEHSLTRMSEDMKCIELTKVQCNEDIITYLRLGIRCYVIDLFIGTPLEKQRLIVRLRESEIIVSRETGFPVTSTIFAKLSPRMQYSGVTDPIDAVFQLEKNDKISLTVDREWSGRCCRKCVYVNAVFLLPDVVPFDYILIGCDIQLVVEEVGTDYIQCVVAEGGELRSRLPVLFPKRCNKYQISIEELEDITFAKEVGINVIVSYIPGSMKYLMDLRECMRMLRCERMDLCTRIVLNDIKGQKIDDYKWIIDEYDGFVIELATADRPEILHLCSAAEDLLKRMYAQKKPILLDATPIVEKRLIIDPVNNSHIYFYPDKYLFKCDLSVNSYIFSRFRNIVFPPITQHNLSALRYCDTSTTGSDTLARACVAASLESNSKLIYVLSLTGRMAIKIAHFRPNVPIIFISTLQSRSDYIMLHYNIRFLPYTADGNESHLESTYRHLLFGLLYAQSVKLIADGDNVMFVYGENPGQGFSDKYIIFKFNRKRFHEHLRQVLTAK